MNNFEFFTDEKGRTVFELPRQQRDIIGNGSNLILPTAIQFDEPIDLKKMEACIQDAYDAYDTLRYVAIEQDGKLFYRIVKNYKYELSLYNAEGDTHEARYKNALDKVGSLCREPIDFCSELSSKFGIIKVEDDQYIFYFIGHPWIADGTACAIISDRIMRMYAGEKTDYPYALQNHEFMEQYLEFEKSEAGKKELEYWENELNDYKTFDISSLSNGEKAYMSDYLTPLPKELFSEAAKKFNTSVYNVFLFTFHMAVYHNLGQNDTMISIPDSCRMKKEQFYIVGNLIRNVPHRLKLSNENTVGDSFRKSIEIVSKGVKNHHVATFDRRLQFATSYNNYRKTEGFTVNNISAKVGNDQREMNLFGITLLELPDGLNMFYVCDYRVSKETLNSFKKSIVMTAETLVNVPEIKVSELKNKFDQEK